jgi:hypothetical protein
LSSIDTVASSCSVVLRQLVRWRRFPPRLDLDAVHPDGLPGGADQDQVAEPRLVGSGAEHLLVHVYRHDDRVRQLATAVQPGQQRRETGRLGGQARLTDQAQCQAPGHHLQVAQCVAHRLEVVREFHLPHCRGQQPLDLVLVFRGDGQARPDSL